MKNRIYARSDITFVAPSSWIEDMVRQSPLLQRFDVRRIPNGLDLSIFRPQERSVARDVLDIDRRQKVILFAAHGVDNNPRKGSSQLVDALKRLPSSQDHMLLLCGEGGEEWHGKVDMPVKVLGYVADDRMMALVYSAADVIVLPSMVENLPNSLLEAMACRVPAVAYDTGGMKDAVRHMDTGYLARYADAADLAQGIVQLTKDDHLRHRMGERAQRLVTEEFEKTRVAKSFLNLYQEKCSLERNDAI
jgi:glycosyltransferase involved in cell wall biosynthesis